MRDIQSMKSATNTTSAEGRFPGKRPRNSSRSTIFASSTSITTEQSGNLDFGTLYAYSAIRFSDTL